jgi:RNA polymerase sigma-70 factor (ECF subfamily)
MAITVATDGAGTDAVLALFDAHQREIYAYLLRMVGDPMWAEDLVQEAFLRALRHRGDLAALENPRAWLYRVATNVALNAIKRRNRFAWLPWREAEARAAPEPDLADAALGRGALEQALGALPVALRAPLLLYGHYGLSVAEVAQALGISVGAAKMRLHRARQALRPAYERGDLP